MSISPHFSHSTLAAPDQEADRAGAVRRAMWGIGLGRVDIHRMAATLPDLTDPAGADRRPYRGVRTRSATNRPVKSEASLWDEAKMADWFVGKLGRIAGYAHRFSPASRPFWPHRGSCVECPHGPVSRFRSSHNSAAGADANFGFGSLARRRTLSASSTGPSGCLPAGISSRGGLNRMPRYAFAARRPICLADPPPLVLRRAGSRPVVARRAKTGTATQAPWSV